MKTWALRLREAARRLAGAFQINAAPEQAALLLSVGLVLGVFPMVGIPTLLCLVAAFVLRLNPAALQLLNSVASPLQVLLLLPLARIGSRLLGGGVAAGSWAERLGLAALHAIAGWALVCIPLGVLLYIGLVLIMRRAHAIRAA